MTQDEKRLRKQVKLLQSLVEAQKNLLAAYRLASNRRAGAAIDRIQKIEEALGKLEEAK